MAKKKQEPFEDDGDRQQDIADFIRPFVVAPAKKKVKLSDYDPGYKGSFIKKKEARKMLKDGISLLFEYQERLYAENTDALLIILQARDAAGKDSAIKHVMRGLNPQGTQVYSFKAPSPEELDHDYLWRTHKAMPERGRIGIFNRSYYEEVLVVKVHPAILDGQHLPPELKDEDVWTRRYAEINNHEKYLTNQGIHIVKIFLNVSRDEQKERFLERIDRPEKNWKFSEADARERAYWDDYTRAYEEMLARTSTRSAPWYVVPADHKWFTRLAVAAIVADKLMEINPHYPEVNDEHLAELTKAREMLLGEE
ncbi:MAG: polyphosphate kinase 2 family protein [Caldilineaceae bacterium]|nr:polyphosphate kinase 2 family protein [Caldilineaceae bacterium]